MKDEERDRGVLGAERCFEGCFKTAHRKINYHVDINLFQSIVLITPTPDRTPDRTLCKKPSGDRVQILGPSARFAELKPWTCLHMTRPDSPSSEG